MMIQSGSSLSLQAALPRTKLSNSLTRDFAYRLTDKKATSNLLKGASKEPFEVDEKQKCSILIFSVGAFKMSVFTTINE